MSVTPLMKVVLRRLFRLKYLEGVSDLNMLADEMGCPPFLVERFSHMLDEYLRSKLNVVTPDRLQFICPECLEARVYEDPETGESVCTNCGLVVNDGDRYISSLPFDTAYALTSNLAFGKSLGGTLGYKGTVIVLARSPATEELAKRGNKHLGLRAQIARIITENVEHPALRSALKMGKMYAEEYGLASNYTFNNHLGMQIKQAFGFAYHLAVNQKFKRLLAETSFWLALVKFGKTEQAKRFLQIHKINWPLAVALEDLDRFLENAVRRGRLRASLAEVFPMEEVTA